MNRYQDFGDGAAVSEMRRLRVERSSRRSIKVWIPRFTVGGADQATYAWEVTTYLKGETICTVDYRSSDYAPDDGYVTHRLD